MTRIRYSCPFVNRNTGERRVITVELARPEVLDCLWQAVNHGYPAEVGWPPLERAYALRRAANGLAPEFEPVITDAHRVSVLACVH
jgi:hypothetical protein